MFKKNALPVMLLGPTVRYRNVFSDNTHDGTELGLSCLISCDYSMQMDRRTYSSQMLQ